MGYKRLPGYLPSARVSAATAKQDKINLVLGDWLVAGGSNPGHSYTQDHAAFLLALTPNERSSFLPPSAADCEPITDWFVRAESRHGTPYPTLVIRKGGRGRGLGIGSPLVTGKLQTRRAWEPFSDDGRRRSALKATLNLNLNPTRFVHHQSLAGWAAQRLAPPRNWVMPNVNLEAGVPRLTDIDEISLDGKDNILMGRANVDFVQGEERWVFSFDRYWAALVRHFDTIFNECAASVPVGIGFVPSVNLRTVETYWEFKVGDPCAWILEVEPLLLPLGLSSEARTYSHRAGLATAGREANSRRIAVTLRSGVKLRVYAKTSHRVRFEIEHNFIENARPLGGTHSSTDLSALYRWTTAAAEDAATEVNRILEALETAQVRSDDDASVAELIVRITQGLGDEALAMQFIMLVAANQSISVPSGSSLRDGVSRLKRRSILEPIRPKSRTYRLTRRFRSAGLLLRQQGFAEQIA